MAAVDAPPPALPPSMLGAMADDTLVGLIAAGSDDAFAALDARYRRRLVRFATGFVPGGTADAEDVVQEAMVRAVRALRKGSRPEATGAWLHRITRNCALDLTAARRRHPEIELVDHAGWEGLVSEDAQATVERRMGVRGLVADVGALPQTQRSALVLRELEGRSYVDIADELDVTVPAVKSLLVRARRGLKQARDGRRVAGWLPFPALLARAGERVTTLWEPVAANATPKVASAAVVVAGSLPMVAAPMPTPTAPVHRQTAQHRTVPAARPLAHATRRTPGPQAAAGPASQRTSGSGTARIRRAAAATVLSAAATAALRDDCRDGTIGSHFSRDALKTAIGDAGQGAEYSDCRQALYQAMWRKTG